MQIALLAFALMSFFFTTTLGSSDRGLAKCKDDTLKCGGGDPGGAVFMCRKGRWEVLIDCGPSESCVTDPIPTCTWAKDSAEGALGVVTGFENPDDLIAVPSPTLTARYDASYCRYRASDTDLSQPEDTTKVDTSTDAPYYNICSPCIRFNDNCKAVVSSPPAIVQ